MGVHKGGGILHSGGDWAGAGRGGERQGWSRELPAPNGLPGAAEAEVRRGGWKGRALVKGLRSWAWESLGGPGVLGEGV